MSYKEHTIKVVVSDDEGKVFTQALTDALERLQELQGVTLYSLEWREQDAPEPENAGKSARL